MTTTEAPIEYTHLHGGDLLDLRHARVRKLEADHFEAMLALEEDPNDVRANQSANELWRRIEHQRAMILRIVGEAEEASAPPADSTPDESGELHQPNDA